jgi:hypothetical protein
MEAIQLPKNRKDNTHMAAKTNNQRTIVLTKEKDCKSVVLFTTDETDALVSNVYVKRPTADNWSEVTLTISGK